MRANGTAAVVRIAAQHREDRKAGSLVGGLLAGLRRRRARIRDQRHLLALEDRLLEDVGLTREMVRRMDFSGRG